jgi:hypothetical protein
MGARRTGAAARGAADLRPSRGSKLGCVAYQHAGARIPWTPTWSSALVTRGAARGVAAASTVPAPKTLHADQFAGETHGDGEHKDMEGPGATSRRGRPQAQRLSCDLVQSMPWCVATAVLAHARPRRARSMQPSGSQRRSSKRGSDAPTIPCTRQHGATAGSKHLPRTATAAPKSTNGSGAPSVAVRQSCGSMASIQACTNRRRVSTPPIHHRKETKGEERIEWPGGANGGAAV